MALITDLPAASSLAATDLLIKDTGSTTQKITAENMASSIRSIMPKLSASVITTFTPAVGSSYSPYGGCYYYTTGSRVHVHIGLSGLTPNANNVIYTMPSGYRPRTSTFAIGEGGTTYTTRASCYIAADGKVNVASDDQYAGIDIEYDLFA